MKQPDIDNWIKNSISEYEETNNNVLWNKSEVFNSILAMQNRGERRKSNWRYMVAAVVVFLVTLNLYQFYQYRAILDKEKIINDKMASLQSENQLLSHELENKEAYLTDFDTKYSILQTKINDQEKTIDDLKAKNSRPIMIKEIEYITETIHDTIFIYNQVIEPNFIKEDFVKDQQNKSIQDQDYLFVSSYKPFDQNKESSKKFPIRIKIGAEESSRHGYRNEPNMVLSADL